MQFSYPAVYVFNDTVHITFKSERICMLAQRENFGHIFLASMRLSDVVVMCLSLVILVCQSHLKLD